MARKFQIPVIYQSSIMSRVKSARLAKDPRKKDKSPSVLDLGSLRFKIARHFGFCFGVENAIEIAYRAVSDNPDKRVFLLSEMIHNPRVNNDLRARGVKFLMSTYGERLMSFDELVPEDIVIIPAFGTSIELFEELERRKIKTHAYNATCPFVEKVWKRATELGERGYSIVIHGKHSHEETKATFSRARVAAPSIIVRDLPEASLLAEYISGRKNASNFEQDFQGRYSDDFSPLESLSRIGVVNQTTMLATETQRISLVLREAIIERYGSDDLEMHFADTRDTLCYATNENQDAVRALVESGGDLAVVVGGYNSSNTSHLVELCEKVMPSYYIKDSSEIKSAELIRHLDLDSGEVIETPKWLSGMISKNKPVDILITAGASCPDIIVDEVITKISSFFPSTKSLDKVVEELE